MTAIEDTLRIIINRLNRLDLNDEVMLYHMDGEWRAEAVNTNWAVTLGEVPGQYTTGWFTSPAEDTNALLMMLPE